MAGRRYADDVSIDRYDDRRDYTSRNGRRVYDDRYVDEEVDYRRGAPVREREREREGLVRDDVRERPRSGLDFLQEGYGRSSAGPVVLAKREREDFEFVPRPRRRSPLPEPERKFEKEEIIVRKRDESTSRPPPRTRERDRGYDREEVIIRRDERETDRRPPPGREWDREEIIFRREERERDVRSPPVREQNTSREENVIRRDETDRRVRYDADYDRDDVVSRRGDYPRSVRGDVERDEIIIRREEQNLSPRGYEDYPLSRSKSHERARSRGRRSSSASGQEIIIRQEEQEGRGGRTRDRQEIIIRRNSRSRSRSPSVASAPVRAPEPQVIKAPTIHQEVVTHHRHIDHGFEVAIPTRPRVISRPPSPPSPPPPRAPAPRARSEERIQISRTQTRNGHTSAEDIVIDRNEGPAAPRPVAPYAPPPPRDPYYEPVPPPRRDYGYDRDVQKEAEYYNSRALERSYVGEGYHGATRDWEIVDVPPGTHRVRMDGAGGGSQEITWQRYNGVRRSKFVPDGVLDDTRARGAVRTPPLPAPAPLPASNGDIGRRYGRERDPTEGLWTEITKDLVVKEAIQEMGYEFEETEDFYYIIAYLRYEDIARLVGLSEDIRRERRKRVKELEWENRVLPPPVVEEIPRPLAIEPPPPPRSRQPWDREEERYIEREIVYKGDRPPPPVAWRR
ncbi:hypothetical protein A1O1_08663 [Capronia coronata CBS 617.96]|uniref:DUF8035 domain-containing protein n=1 Tax=Capronia coronata CBS 617.96 TaxID=1182541 RepID=W9XJ25_9EURO|nr:uncharacterized protein A1O1_08663 [Capronia coronata CBS 617.96]EXJ80517.1 hypothetical protein A1O1_08663 [Capronia coronata CBS 617.96]